MSHAQSTRKLVVLWFMLAHSEVQVAGLTKYKYYSFIPQVVMNNDKLNNYNIYTKRQEVTSTSILLDYHTSTFTLVEVVRLPQ